MDIRKILGCDVREILAAEPFRSWPMEQSVEGQLDEPRTHYVFSGHGLAISCDADLRVRTIFLFSEEYGGFDDSELELHFSSPRAEVLATLGPATTTGERTSDPILGDHGAWDRFARPGFAIHVEYHSKADRIRNITLMRSDVVP